MDELVRAEAERILSEQHPGLVATVGDAKLIEGRGVELRNIVWHDARRGPRDGVIAEVREIFLVCRADWKELLARKFDITQIQVREPRLHLQRGPDGRWLGLDLLAAPQHTIHDIPPIFVSDGSIDIFDSGPGAAPAATNRLRFSRISLRIDSPRQAEDGAWVSTLSGVLGGDHLQQVKLHGQFCLDTFAWTVNGQVQRLRVAPELLDSLPIEGDSLEMLRGLRAEVDLAFSAVSDIDARWGARFHLAGQIVQGRWDDLRLDHPLVDISSAFDITQDVIVLRDFHAMSAATRLRLQCHWRAYRENGPLWLAAQIQDLELTRGIQRLLPPSLSTVWSQYDPAGRIHLDAELLHEDDVWSVRKANVDCVDLSFSHYRYPYRAERGRGSITLTPDGTMQVGLLVSGGGKPIEIRGTIHQATTTPYGSIRITATDLPIDEKLMRALSPRAQDVIRSLNPTGTARLTATLSSDAPGRPFETSLRIGLNRCSARYDRFAYQLSTIEGAITLDNHLWRFENLVARHGSATIYCNGYLVTSDDDHELRLEFVAQRVTLDDELRGAFPQPTVQRLWDDLKLRGMADVRVHMYHTPHTGLHVSFDANPYPEQTSVQPHWFPYRLENLQGEVGFRDGCVTIRDLRARHGEVKLAANARCDFQEDGSWQLHLDHMAVDQLRIDREFLESAPAPLKAAIAPLKLQGPVNLSGRVYLAGNPDGLARADWDLNVALHQVDADVGLPVEAVCGGLTIRGCHTESDFYCSGQLSFDSLMYRGVQVTAVRGPYWIGRDQILLGKAAAVRPSTPCRFPDPHADEAPRSVVAKALGGQFTCDGWVGIDAIQAYRLLVTLEQADLRTLTRELSTTRQAMQGTVYATAEIAGRGHNLNLLQANGSLRLRRADVRELPLMVSLLQILSIRESERAAFSDADIAFRIQQGHILLDDIQFNGNAFSLKGRGELGFDQNIKLRLGTRLGRPNGQAPLLREVLGAAGEQIVVVDVEGTLEKPVILRKPFPVFQEAFEQLLNDLSLSTAVSTPGTPPTARPPGPIGARPDPPNRPFWRF